MNLFKFGPACQPNPLCSDTCDFTQKHLTRALKGRGRLIIWKWTGCSSWGWGVHQDTKTGSPVLPLKWRCSDRRWRSQPSRLPAAWGSQILVWRWKAELLRKWRVLEERISTSLPGRPNVRSITPSSHCGDCGEWDVNLCTLPSGDWEASFVICLILKLTELPLRHLWAPVRGKAHWSGCLWDQQTRPCFLSFFLPLTPRYFFLLSPCTSLTCSGGRIIRKTLRPYRTIRDWPEMLFYNCKETVSEWKRNRFISCGFEEAIWNHGK